MFFKTLADKKELLKSYTWFFAPMNLIVSNLTMYQEYLGEYRAANIQSIDDEIDAASREKVEVSYDLENGETVTIKVSEREMALDYFEDEYYENNYLFDTFLLEGFIYKSHQQLDLIMRKLCEKVEQYSNKSFNAFASSYKKKDQDAPLLLIRGEYLQSILSPNNDPDRGAFKDLAKELERASIVRNCVMHEDNQIDNAKFVPKLKQFFQNNACGKVEERAERKIIVLNYQYPDYLIKLIKKIIPFMQNKLVEWLKA